MVLNERKWKILMSNEGIMKKYVLDINECLWLFLLWFKNYLYKFYLIEDIIRLMF